MLPGGENYSELVLKLPEGSLKGGESEYFDAPSGHRFPEDNILAHIRFTERIDADGKKMLFLEEVQSDWNIEGRERGFKKKRPAKVQEELDRLKAESFEVESSDVLLRLGLLDSNRESRNKVVNEIKQLQNTKQKEGSLSLSELESTIKYLDDEYARDANQKDFKKYSKEDLEKIRQEAKDLKDRIKEIETEYPDYPAGAPDMPYKGSKWEDLVMKRMIRYAADNGYERLGWITGKDTADRYNLSKKVNDLYFNKNEDNTYDVKVNTVEGEEVDVGTGLTADKLKDFIGKDIANKIVNTELGTLPITELESRTGDRGRPKKTYWNTLSGEDLNIGGEWAENLYDKSLPSKAKKITKKKGAVGRTRLGGDTKKRQELLDELKEVEEDIAINKDILNYKPYLTPLHKRRKREIERKIKELDKKGTPEANYVDITPEVKEIAEEGFSYFMPAGRAGAGSAPMQTGSPQPPSAGVFMPKVKLTEEEKEESKRILEKL